MKKEDYKLHLEPEYPEWGVKINAPLIGSSFEIPKQVVIESDHIYIKHKDLGFDIDVDTKRIKELNRIIINGILFIREN